MIGARVGERRQVQRVEEGLASGKLHLLAVDEALGVGVLVGPLEEVALDAACFQLPGRHGSLMALQL